MKIQNNKGGITLIASGIGEEKCPRILVKGGASALRDDYKGAISLRKGLAARIFSRL